MKFICCGDSFFSLDPNFPNTHFTEVLRDKHNWQYKNFAKLGASNFMIALQIDYAIKNKPDLIVFGFSSVDRMEIPISNYQYPEGIKNIVYESHTVKPLFYEEQKTKTISQSFPNIEKTEAIKLYISELYDSELKRQQDFYIASSILYKLDKLKIPYIFTRGGLSGPDWSEWAENEIDVKRGNPWRWTDGTPVYHSSPETQIKLSDVWFSKIEELNLISNIKV